MDKMRCFIAVELPPEVKDELTALEGELRKGRHNFVKWVHPDNIHLTLKFLGATPVEKIRDIISTWEWACSNIVINDKIDFFAAILAAGHIKDLDAKHMLLHESLSEIIQRIRGRIEDDFL